MAKNSAEPHLRVDDGELRRTVEAILEASGFPSEHATLASDVLVAADVRGVDTHGVSNMLRRYLTWTEAGHLNPRPRMRLISESKAGGNFDGDQGLGIVAAPKAMALAIEKASVVGVGLVTVHNSRHLGMAAYHAMLALEHDMIGICASAVGPIVVPTFGRDPRLGTNPIAVAAPAATEPAFVFDAATSAIAANRVTLSHRLGVPLPPGVIAAEDGTPLLQPSEAPATYALTRLLPLGSTRDSGSHKGYGIAAAIEILCTVLSGSELMVNLGRDHASHLVCAINIGAFTDIHAFKERMDEFLLDLKATPPAPGHERVLVAGQLEWEAAQERLIKGIPLHPEIIEWFDSVCGQLGLPRLSRSEGSIRSDGTDDT